MEVIDMYCGVGGFSAGAMQSGCKPVAGYDCDDCVLRLWAGNTGGKGVVAKLWSDRVTINSHRQNLHIHLSPPCTSLSNARRKGGGHDPADGERGIRQSIAVVIKNKFTSWSLENVSTPQVRALMDELVVATPHLVAYTTVDAADFGAPTTRRRLIAGPPAMIQRLRETPVVRVSVAEAFISADTPLPAQFIKNSTRTRNGGACVRSVQGPAHTQTASHPLMWCKADGTTVRCLSVAETAIIQGFPARWMLPSGSRAGIRALGNAVPPCLARAVMLAACEACGVERRTS
jgi:site-specific DNA-cytosine methylase